LAGALHVASRGVSLQQPNSNPPPLTAAAAAAAAAAGIEDVSVLQQMSSIEVLSLSVNKISTLRHFAFCGLLKQLYLRANAINDLSEIR
jgi:hypothetical protein